MGKYSSKLLILALLSFYASFSIPIFAGIEGSDTVNIEMKTFIRPQYDDQTHLLKYILYGDYAKTEGAIIRVINAKIEFIGKDGKTVTSILTSPEIFYNQSTQFINGNKPLKYRAEDFDADGVGFDASQGTEFLHIRKDVKLLLKALDRSKYSFTPDGTESDSNTNTDSEKFNDTSITDTTKNTGDRK